MWFPRWTVLQLAISPCERFVTLTCNVVSQVDRVATQSRLRWSVCRPLPAMWFPRWTVLQRNRGRDDVAQIHACNVVSQVDRAATIIRPRPIARQHDPAMWFPRWTVLQPDARDVWAQAGASACNVVSQVDRAATSKGGATAIENLCLWPPAMQ
jgi:hypothetical protein